MSLWFLESEELAAVASGFFLGWASVPSLGTPRKAEESFQLKLAYSEIDSSYKYLWLFPFTYLFTSPVENSL